MHAKSKYSVCTIVHHAFLDLLEKHLESLEDALAGVHTQVPIKLLLSYYKTDLEEQNFINIISKHPKLDIQHFTLVQRLTCAEARNYLFQHISTDWCVFFDSDVTLSKEYFIELDRVLSSTHNLTDIKALAGGMGTWGTTDWGYNEYLMDMYAYYGKAEGIDIKKLDLTKYATTLNEEMPDYSQLSMRKMHYLQGYNQIVHRTMYTDYGGYDNSYFGAEDREMAARIYNNGFEIRLVPQLLVYHYFNFSRNDVCRRKYGHGYYSAKFRDKYRNLKLIYYERGWLKWLKYFGTLFFVPVTFRSWNRYKYYQWAFWTYFFGSAIYNAEKVTGLKLFKIFELGTSNSQSNIIARLISGFNYSNYDFAKTKDNK